MKGAFAVIMAGALATLLACLLGTILYFHQRETELIERFEDKLAAFEAAIRTRLDEETANLVERNRATEARISKFISATEDKLSDEKSAHQNMTEETRAFVREKVATFDQKIESYREKMMARTASILEAIEGNIKWRREDAGYTFELDEVLRTDEALRVTVQVTNIRDEATTQIPSLSRVVLADGTEVFPSKVEFGATVGFDRYEDALKTSLDRDVVTPLVLTFDNFPDITKLDQLQVHIQRGRSRSSDVHVVTFRQVPILR